MRFDKILRSTRRRPRRSRSGRRLRFEPLETRGLLATFLVSNLDDSGLGSLRQAVLDANVATGADEIEFQSGLTGTIPLTSGQIEITDALTITGPGAENLTIDAQQNSRIFEVAKNSGTVRLDGLTLTGGKTSGRGGAVNTLSNQSDSDLLIVTNSVISGNHATRGGGGIYSYRGQVIDSTLSNNEAGSHGGGVRGYFVDVRGSTISSNSSGGYGGAIHSGRTVEVRDSTISENTARNSAVSAYTTLLVSNSRIENNTADHNAGLYGQSSATVTDSTITGNSADAGSAVTTFGDATITRTNISQNDAEGITSGNELRLVDSMVTENASGVFASSDAVLRNSTISSNQGPGLLSHGNIDLIGSAIANNAGIGIRADKNVTLNNSTVADNTGVGIKALQNVTLTDSTVSGSGEIGINADRSASLIRSSVTGSADRGICGYLNVELVDSTVSGNRGGGIYARRSATLTGSTVSGNVSQQDGGGIEADDELTIVDSTISGNTAMGRGGGIYAGRNKDVVITNSTISGNSARSGGGGIHSSLANIVISNSTVTDNWTDLPGTGGIFAEGAAGLTIRSSIVAGNRAFVLCLDPCSMSPPDISRLEAMDVTSSLIGNNLGTNLAEAPLGSPDANGNLIGDGEGSGVIDPRLGALADNGGPTETHLLLAGSPAIDAGANPLGLDLEQRGLPRQYRAAVDMGAVEMRPNIFVVNSTGDEGDVNPGDGACDAGSGDCTLRAAIDEANARTDLTFPDEIHFNITGAGLHIIQPLSPLPTITDVVVIDGTTQVSSDSVPLTSGVVGGPSRIEIDGSLAGDGASGFKINVRGGGSTVRGLAINRFDAHGIFLSRSAGNHIEGNFIGTDATGTMDLGNGDAGVMILNGADNFVGGLSVDGNVVSGNRRGVVISGRLASGNQIVGNFVGVDASGAAALGNRGAGIEIAGAPNNAVGSFEGINVISGNRVGVEIRSAAATGNTVILNKIGTDESGQTALPNRIGVSIRNGASANQVLGNQVAGNLGDGVNLTRADGNRIDANQIGGNGLGNGGDGVDIRGGQGNVVGGNLAIASNAPDEAVLDLAQGNRISANGGYGVNVVGDDNLIQLNTIGTSVQDALGNQRGGVQILKGSHHLLRENQILKNHGPGVLINGSAATANRIQGNIIGAGDLRLPLVGNTVGVEIRNSYDNLIGGSAPDERNRIFGNDKYGIHIHGAATGNRVQGNVIGLAELSFPSQPLGQSGSVPVTFGIARPNGRDGVFVEADGNVIGGSAEGAGNVISGNARYGLLLMGDGNRVQGNQIGTYADGTKVFPSGADGLRVHGSNNIIGGTEPGAGNLIAFNGVSGVRISSGTGNAITRNSIYKNSGLGIDLGRLGPNANDRPLDADAGANNLQNTPEILRTLSTATHIQIIFYVPSQAPHSAFPIRVEFFVADDDGEEGRTFLTATDVSLPTPAVISIPLTDLSPGSKIVATATDADGNTSEFSAPFATEPPPATTADEAAADFVFQDFGE